MSEKQKIFSIKTWIVSVLIGLVFLFPFILIIFPLIMRILPEESGVIERWGQGLIVLLLFMGLFRLIWKVIEKIRDEIDLLGLHKAILPSFLKAATFTVCLTIWTVLIKWIATFEFFKSHATSLTLGMVILLLIGLLILGMNLWKKKHTNNLANPE